MGTIGGLNIGLFLFDKALSELSDTEKSCYSLINKIAINVVGKLIKEKSDIFKIKLDEKKTEETLQQLIKIYSFKETDYDSYQKWNSLVPYDHPIVKRFKQSIINLLMENENSQYIEFETQFNLQFQSEIIKSDIFIKYQKEKSLENISETRKDYFSWILNDLDKPNPVDNKKAADYYTKNRAIELEIFDDIIEHKDNWNITDYEVESLYNKDKGWKIESFLNSNERIKVIAAPFGTGKTSFAKYTAQNLIINREAIQIKDTWIPIYITQR